MRRFLRFLGRHKRHMILAMVLLAVGACFRWEISKVDDARTGQRLPSHHRVVVSWHAFGANGDGRLISFHVRHWLWYGLVKVEARGQTM